VVPRQTAGKAVAALLMVGGLSFLSILTATITSSFVTRRQDRARARGDDPVMQELRHIAQRLDELERELERPRRPGASPNAAPDEGSDPA
jgi:voltage-gated potassium channel